MTMDVSAVRDVAKKDDVKISNMNIKIEWMS